MSAQEDHGEPSLCDGMLELALLFERRGAFLQGLRAYLSAISAEDAEGILQAVLIETRNRLGH